jgi:phosphatidate cytidylyltransferase
VWLLPPWATVALSAIVAAGAATELAGLSRKLGAAVPAVFLGAATAVVVVAFVAGDAGAVDARGAVAAVLLTFVVAAGAMALTLGPPDAGTMQRVGALFMGPGYLGLPLGALAAIRVTDGPAVLTLLFVMLTVSDSAQYYTGRQFGRRKLAPAVSPAKTVEGAYGGFVAAAIVGAALGPRWIPGLSPAVGALLAFTLAGAGMVGDLFESLLKRGAGVKDSSALIPGHGGLLDRLDSYLFAAPLYYLFLRYLA